MTFILLYTDAADIMEDKASIDSTNADVAVHDDKGEVEVATVEKSEEYVDSYRSYCSCVFY